MTWFFVILGGAILLMVIISFIPVDNTAEKRFRSGNHNKSYNNGSFGTRGRR
ncbi:MAG: hypothetical protein AB7E61_03315 [Acholeplasmataceae bacterium]